MQRAGPNVLLKEPFRDGRRDKRLRQYVMLLHVPNKSGSWLSPPHRLATHHWKLCSPSQGKESLRWTPMALKVEGGKSLGLSFARHLTV
jgi:hypothetical protein